MSTKLCHAEKALIWLCRVAADLPVLPGQDGHVGCGRCAGGGQCRVCRVAPGHQAIVLDDGRMKLAGGEPLHRAVKAGFRARRWAAVRSID